MRNTIMMMRILFYLLFLFLRVGLVAALTSQEFYQMWIVEKSVGKSGFSRNTETEVRPLVQDRIALYFRILSSNAPLFSSIPRSLLPAQMSLLMCEPSRNGTEDTLKEPCL
jgi:hypothetical protein